MSWEWPQLQAKKGKRSGEIRRASVSERDRFICELRQKGLTQQAIGDRVGLTQQEISYILKRDA